MTATVETVSEQLDLTAIIPAERVMSAVARAVTLSETDVATATVSVAKPQIVGENDQPVMLSPENELDDFWHTSVGKFRFTIEDLPEQLQYIHKLLKEIIGIDKPDILYYMLQCLNIMCLHGDAFNTAVKDHQGFFIWCQENLLIKTLWELCNAEHSHIAQVTVPLLLHCITLPCGADTFWHLIQEEFHSCDWRVRFVAVERVTLIARFMDSTPLRSVPSLQAALTNAFCYLITSMDDNNVHVAQRATLYLGTIHDTAIRSLIFCLETQFDSVIVDRPMVLQSLYQLHNSLSDRRILTWDFFLNRFDSLYLEAQINLEKAGDIAYLRDLRNTDLSSEIFIRKLHRAHEALSLSDGSSTSLVKTLSASFGTKWPYKRTMSAPASTIPRQDTKQDGHIHSLNMAEEGGNLPGFIHKVIDLEESDKETMHLLVFLLMQFLSRADQAYPTDEKPLCKTQGIILRHLYLLLGYNQLDRTFHTSPQRLRVSPVFNVFIANLPQLLDQNHIMGWVMVPPVLAVLQHCPCPPQGVPPVDHQPPTYSLWYLEPHIRRTWLMSLLVLLYKYQYGQQPWCNQLQSLIKIVLNTLDTQHHQCRRIPATVVMGGPPSRSRDVSQPSLGADHELGTGCAPEVDGESPPVKVPSTIISMHQRSPGTNHAQSHAMETHWEESAPSYTHKHSSYSINADDTESELAAIPESPKSDCTLHCSSSGSLGEIEEHSGMMGRNVATTSKTVLHSADVDILISARRNTIQDSNHSKQECLSRRPMWFLGSDDDALQVNNGPSQKKWGVHEGVKMMVTSAFLAGQQNSQKSAPPTVPVAKPTLVMQSGSNDSGISNKPLFGSTGLASAIAVATGLPNIGVAKTVSVNSYRSEISPKEKGLTIGVDQLAHVSPVSKHFGRQKHVEQTTPLTSPVSISQLTPTTSQQICSDQSSSPAVSSMSSQLTSTENCDHGISRWQVASTQQQIITPIVERLLPIGTVARQRTTHRVLMCEDAYGSPESPLSKMDILTVGSSFDQDSETCVSSDVTTPRSISQLEFPLPERLLPVGPQRDSITGLIERVCQAFGVPAADDVPHLNNEKSSIEKKGTCYTQHSKRDAFTTDNRTPSSSILTPNANELHSRSPSPRKLMKQVALESPPPIIEESFFRSSERDRKTKMEDLLRSQREKMRKTPFNMTQHSIGHIRRLESWPGPQIQANLDPMTQQAYHADFNLKQSLFRIGDECVYDRCSECGTIKEEYSDEELGLCIITLGTFIHREPSLAAPLLPEILSVVAKVALNAMYPWQNETNMHLPGGAVSVAHQFLRCVLHQLAPNGVFVQMFQTHTNETTRMQFFKSVAQALIDFNELNPIAPLQFLLESLNTKKTLPIERLPTILHNVACYLDCLPLEAGLGPGAATWGGLLSQIDGLFRRLVLLLNSIEDITPLLRIMISVLKVPGILQFKAMLDPFSKVLSYAIQNSILKYNYLTDLCYLCHRGFVRDRDKYFLSRTIVFELVQAIKFKTTIPDSNFLLLIHFILQDVGGMLPMNVAMEDIQTDVSPIYNTNASESLRSQLAEVLDFLADCHTLSKVKSYSKGLQAGLNEDTLGGMIKCGLAQYMALEITRGNSRDNRAVWRYLPWLYSGPSTPQQGSREFVECMSHVRLLSWLLLGSLTHTALHGNNNTWSGNPHIHGPPTPIAQPIPQEVSCHIADHIQVILSGFPEQSKTSVLHMSSLFHTFILCQLWTVYLEEVSKNNSMTSETHNVTMSILLDFWGKVTPCVLQLVSHSKVLAEMVNLHFLSLLEALLECQSTLLSKLLPLWSPILFAHHIQLPGQLQMRLQNCRNFPPIKTTEHSGNLGGNGMEQRDANVVLLQWLHRLQFKMGQIESQSSTATQFYTF